MSYGLRRHALIARVRPGNPGGSDEYARASTADVVDCVGDDMPEAISDETGDGNSSGTDDTFGKSVEAATLFRPDSTSSSFARSSALFRDRSEVYFAGFSN